MPGLKVSRRRFTPKSWISGSWISLSSKLATGTVIAIIVAVLLILLSGAVSYFWPRPIYEFWVERSGEAAVPVHGIIAGKENAADGSARLLIRSVTAAGDDPATPGTDRLPAADYVWLPETAVVQRSRPHHLTAMETRDGRWHWGYVVQLQVDGEILAYTGSLIDFSNQLLAADCAAQQHMINALRPARVADACSDAEFIDWRLLFEDAERRQVTVAGADILQLMQPNGAGLLDRIASFATHLVTFRSPNRYAPHHGQDIVAAIYGTVLMVLVMSLVVSPLGGLAAVYLHEYAGRGWLATVLRVAVNNLAGVPSIIYGVFGLGFFIHAVGGRFDQWFFADKLPVPTFGTGGLLWAAMTLALLTLPVVIVATEEALARIPRSLKEGGYALGATQSEAVRYLLWPLALPGLLTGMILAVARAAGEVAPLMLLGVVKQASSLPIDGNFPFLHLERKFMHLGYYLYDLAFRNTNLKEGLGLLFAVALLLVVVVLVLNLSAVFLRNRLYDRYRKLMS